MAEGTESHRTDLCTGDCFCESGSFSEKATQCMWSSWSPKCSVVARDLKKINYWPKVILLLSALDVECGNDSSQDDHLL